jgi:hypothetical protein
MTGGLDIKAMDIPKKLFATARAFAEGGSLTVVGTALVDTNSRMDEAIFQEFKGTGNMELVLDRRLADRRIWPSIDISQSGTRREELLQDPETYEAVTMLRRTLSSMHPCDAMEQLTKQLGRFETNDEFIKLISGAKTSLLSLLEGLAVIVARSPSCCGERRCGRCRRRNERCGESRPGNGSSPWLLPPEGIVSSPRTIPLPRSTTHCTEGKQRQEYATQFGG